MGNRVPVQCEKEASLQAEAAMVKIQLVADLRVGMVLENPFLKNQSIAVFVSQQTWLRQPCKRKVTVTAGAVNLMFG